MIIPTVCIVGSKNSGKTTVAKELIAELSRRGIRVAAAKHSHHSFDFSAPGRDTTFLDEAGAESVFFISDNQTVCLRRSQQEEKLSVALARYAACADVLVAEGWRGSALPKVLAILEEEKATEREFPSNIAAVVCPAKLPIEAPHFQPNQITELTDHLLSGVLAKKQKAAATITVNGNYLPAKGFIQDFVANTIVGMISSLKGVERLESVQIAVRLHGE